MLGPESRIARIINRTRQVLGLERGRTRWENIGRGFILTGSSEAIWSISDLVTGNILFGATKILSSLGLVLAGHALEDPLARAHRITMPELSKKITTGLGIGNLVGIALIHSGNRELFLPGLALMGVSTVGGILDWVAQHDFVMAQIHQDKPATPPII